jgi:subtilisin family serine protease
MESDGETMLDRLANQKRLLLLLTIGGLLVLIASGTGLWYLTHLKDESTPTPSASLPTPPPDLVLTLPPSLEELSEEYPDLAPILKDKALGSVYKDFILAYEQGGIEAAEKLARQRGLLTEQNDIRMSLLVDSPENTQAVVEELQAFGIQIANYADDEINILIPMSLVEEIAEQSENPHLIFSQLTQLEHILRIKLPIPTTNKESLLQQNIIGEGVAVIRANEWHQAGFTGAGVKVGVLDLGFAGYRDLLGNELPPDLITKAFLPYSEEIDDTYNPHGTACAEIVHEIAPDAELFLVMFDGQDDISLSDAVDWLVAQGVQIISYSAGTSYGPKDGTGWDAQLVDATAAKGILWVSASGNEADRHFRTTYNDSDNDAQHEFPDGHELMAFSPTPEINYFEILLQWNDWDLADQDYELHLYDSAFNLLASSTEPQEGNSWNEPVEYIYYEDSSLDDVYYLAIEAYDQSWDATFDLYVTPVELAFYTPEHSLTSPADAVGAFTVGATEWRDDSLAFYSSQGPTDDGRIKPDITGPTTVSGASYGPEAFDGTSAATPHVSGAAALVWSAYPEFSREQVIAFLQQNVIDLGPAGPDSAYGYGRVQMPDPQQPGEVAVPPTVAPTTPSEAPTAEATAPALGLEIPTLQFEIPTLELPGFPTALPEISIPTLPSELPTVGIPTLPAELPTLEIPTLIADLPPMEIPSVPGVTSQGPSNAMVFTMLTSCLIAGVGCGGLLFVGGIGIFLLQRRRTPKPVTPSYPSPPIATAPWLEFLGRRYDIPATGLSIGRERDNQLILNDSGVSRHHAQITFIQGYWYLQDLGSVNGSLVNGQPVNQHILQEGDRITLGNSHLIFHAR